VGSWRDLPGQFYPRLPHWPDGRFAFSGQGDVFFVVPGGFDLRLYLYNRDSRLVNNWSWGRLWGYVQPRGRYDTEGNVRHGWT
jgi:hypothetical protein